MNGNLERISKRGICLPAVIADGLARHHAHEQLIFKQKLKTLNRSIRHIVLENAALCDTVSAVQDDLAVAIEERQYLLRKLMQIQLSSDQQLQQHMKTLPDYKEEENEKAVLKNDTGDKLSAASHVNRSPFVKRKFAACSDGDKLSSKKRCKGKSSQMKRKCPPLPFDSSGKPIFPLTLGGLTIHSLGDIAGDKEGYHDECMIYPIGFCSSRMYASLKNPHQQTLYTCTIQDAGTRPRFHIVCDEDNLTFYGTSAWECHVQILKKINMILGIDLLPTSLDTSDAEKRGLRFFGLSHPILQYMIQACPGAKKCSKYSWVHFEVCKSEIEAEDSSEPDREASICHQTLLRNIRFASNHM